MPRLTPFSGAWLIAGLACAAYLPSLDGGFILDDDVLLTDSPYVAAPDGLYQFWFTTEPADYYPVFNTTLWIEWRLWGLHPAGYHVTNLLLHIASALLVWAVLQRLLVPGAFFAALLFAVHPVNVQTVAWVAERKDLLAIVFGLLSVLWYLRAEKEAGPGGETRLPGKWYWFSLLAFVLAMLSKGSPAILPLVLLGLAWWQRRQITALDVWRSVPFFLTTIGLTLVNIWCQNRMLGESLRSGFAERFSGAGVVVWFYLSKALLPINLIFIYPLWHIRTSNVLWWLPLVAAVAVTVWLVWQTRAAQAKWSRALLFAWGFFCVALAPVMGFADVGFMKFSLVADHYQHIALLGVVALVAAAWRLGFDRAPNQRRPIVMAIAVVITSLLTFLTWQRCRLYADAITLYQATLAKNPDSWMIHNNLGGELNQAGQPLEAIEQFQEAVRLNPNYPEAFNNLGIVLGRLGRIPEALAQFQQALALNPNYAEAHSDMGLALFKLDRIAEAIDHYETALRLKPNSAEAHAGLASALAHEGRYSEAVEHYQQALKIKPELTGSWARLAEAYAQLQKPTEAIAAAQQAIELARSQQQSALADEIDAWLTKYRASLSNQK